nr:MAG TPA: hypothetical protein [Caudoviricetes sp.]
MTRRAGKRFAFLKRQSYARTAGTLSKRMHFGKGIPGQTAERRWVVQPNERTAVCSW